MKKLVQFLADDTQLKDMDRLKHIVDAKSRTQVIIDALTLLAWAATEKAQGRIVGSYSQQIKRDHVVTEVMMPALQRVRVIK